MDFYKSLLNTSLEAGIKVISDEDCCKLLAWVYAYGGGREEVVYNVKLREDVFYAQKRLNIYGGERPNPELFSLLQKYLKEVKPDIEPMRKRRTKSSPEWVDEIYKKYNLKK